MGVWVVCMTRNSDDADVSFGTPHGEMLTINDGELAVGCRSKPVTWWLGKYSGGLEVREEAYKLAQRHGYTDVELAWVLGRLEAHYDQCDFTLEPPTPDCFVLIVGGRYGRSWDYADTDWFDDNSDPRALVTVEGADDPRDMPGDVICLLDELGDIVRSEIGLDRITPPEPGHAEGRIAGGPAWTTDPDAEVFYGDLVLKDVTERGLENLKHGSGTGQYLKSVVRADSGSELREGEVLLKVSSARRGESNVPESYWRDLGIAPDQTWQYDGKTYKLKDEKPREVDHGDVWVSWGPTQGWMYAGEGEPTYRHPLLGLRRPILEPAP